MSNILHKILEDTQKAVQGRKKAMPLSQLRNENNKNNFLSIFVADKPVIIAEIKAKSPSHGEYKTTLSIEDRAKLYYHAGADAISYVSNLTFFGGLPKNIAEIKKTVPLPVLQKDFVIDTYQVHEAAHFGTDALLLIARIVSKEKLKKLVEECCACNIEPVVEVFDEQDLEKLQGLNVKVVGVNARDLDTLTTDIDKACTIISEITADYTVIGFSGVSSKEDREKYSKAGAKGVLVGAGVMKSNSVTHFIDSLK